MEKILSDLQFKQLHSLLEEASSIVICAHTSPDGDAIGSTLALMHFLRRKGKQATVAVPNIFPDFLKWLPGTDEILINTLHPGQVKDAAEKADLIIFVDVNQSSRLAELEPVVLANQCPRILIDHHLNPDDFCSLTISRPDMCATGELLCHLLFGLDELDNITLQEATCLYSAMMCDTGAFSYNSNRPVIFECISRLLMRGIDKDLIYRNVYWTASEARLRLQGFLLYEKMQLLHDGHASIMTLTNQERQRLKVKNGDTEGMVNIPLQMLGVRLSIFIGEDAEHPGIMRLSLRSVDDFPCNQMAKQFFDGGGHKNASGGRLNCTMDEAIRKVHEAIDNYAEMLK